MAQHHYLGFQQFAGRGLRYVAEYEKRWLALIGWQSGAFKCRPRDRWIGWRPREQFPRLRLIANNTRLLVLAPPGALPNLATCVMAANLRRLSADWQEAFGHPLELAEAFVDPKRFAGTLYRAGNWEVGRAHPRVLAQQRSLHRAPRPPQADVPLSASARGPKTPALAPAVPLLGAGAPGSGASGRGRVAVVAARVRLHPGSPPTPGPQVQAADPCWRSGSWRACPGTGASTPLGVMPAL